MIQSPFDEVGVTVAVALVVLAGALGVLLGRLYFRSVQTSTRFLVQGGSRARLLGTTLLRFVLLGVVLAGVARVGALPLLAALGGLLVGRGLVLRRAEREVS